MRRPFVPVRAARTLIGIATALLAASCGRDRPTAPDARALAVRVHTAPRSPAAPAVGPVDSMRFALRGPDGNLLSPPVEIAIAPDQERFSVALEAVPGENRSVTVLAVGNREIAGTGNEVPPVDRGILFAGSVEGIDITAGRIPTIDVALGLFVPEFLAPQTTRGSAVHTVRWTAVPVADHYVLKIMTSFGSETVSVRDTKYEAQVLPARYQVRAVTPQGIAGAPSDVQQVLGDVPNPPALSVDEAVPGHIAIFWTSSGDGVDGYEVQRGEGVLPVFTTLVTTAGSVHAHSDATVTPGTDYTYRVRALAPAGASDWSNPVNATAPFAPPGAPTNLTVSLNAGTNGDLRWTAPAMAADSIEVEKRPYGGGFGLIARVGGTTTFYRDAGLADGTGWEYRARGMGRGGLSAYSNTASVLVPLAVPDGFTADAPSPNLVQLAWNDNSMSETGYEIQRRSVTSDFVTLVTLQANLHQFGDETVEENAAYTYRVRAVNDLGTSAWSAERTVMTPLAPPAAPSGLTITDISASRITLSWTDNASTEAEFELQRAVGSGGFTTLSRPAANATTFGDGSVQPLTSYRYRIRAVNVGGSSAFSNEASGTTPDVPPGAPLNLQAAAPAFGRVDLVWETGTGNVAQHVVERRIAPAAFAEIATVAGDGIGYTDLTVAASTTYDYRVKAVNTAGDSPYSNTAQITTLPPPPGAPQNLVAEPITPARIDLSWSLGTGLVASQTIERRIPPAAFAQRIVVNGTAKTFSDTNVLEGTTYEYRVRASNAAGDSPYSNTAQATTPFAPPAAPTNLIVTFVGTSAITIEWKDNSTTETGFEVERAVATGAFGTVAVLGAGTQSYASTDLASATLYLFRVRAVNSGGKSAYSNTVQATTLPPPPSAPVQVNTDGLSSSIGVYWQDTSNNEDGFRVERSLDGGPYVEIGTTGPNAFMFEDLNPVCEAIHAYRVRAYNAGGNSAYADAANTTFWACGFLKPR